MTKARTSVGDRPLNSPAVPCCLTTSRAQAHQPVQHVFRPTVRQTDRA